jgi:hypothetical protein
MPSKGNPQITVRVDPVLKAGLDAYALAKRISRAELVRRVLLEFAREVGVTQRGVGVTLDRISALIKTLEAQALSVGIAGLDTQKEREQLYDTAMALLKEAIKLSENEEAAKSARARMEAMRLANAASRTAEAILRGYDRRDVEGLLQELRETNESLQAQLRADAETATADTGGPRSKASK